MKSDINVTLTETQTTYNEVGRGVHGVAERANAPLEETFVNRG